MPYDIIIGRDESDKKEFENKGLIYIGKGFVKMGQYTSLSNKIFLDVIRTHVVLIAGKRGCLTEDTLIFTDKGYKLIKEFDEKKDKILSFNKETKNFEWENAELLKYSIQNEKLLQIELKDGRIINLTKEHPLLKTIISNNQLILMWEKAENFKINDSVLSINNSNNNSNAEDLMPVKIKKILEIENIKEVYDLSVDKNHSFIANGIISHNSGKSYTIGVFAEQLADLPKEVSQNIASIIFDTMGIYWTMKYQNEKDRKLLEEWNLTPKNLPVKIFVPYGHFDEYEEKGVPVDKKFALDITEMNAEDWIMAFELELINPVGVLIQSAIARLKKSEKKYFIEDIINEIEKDANSSRDTKNAAIGLFQAADSWGIFAGKGTKQTNIIELVSAGKTTVLDLSVYRSIGAFNVRALVVSLVSRKLFEHRMAARKKEEIDSIVKRFEIKGEAEKKEMPLIWMFIDEAHEFLPLNKKTIATDALVQLLREGRQPGISMILATQQPGKIHRDVMTQSDIVLSHKLTSKQDLTALNHIMQSYMLESISQYMNELPNLKGSGIILDDTSERIYPMRIHPRFTWHGGEAPTSVKREKKI